MNRANFPRPSVDAPGYEARAAWLEFWMLLAAALGLNSAAAVSALTWPAPPAPARIRYVQSVSSPADLGIRRSIWGRALGLLTGQGQRVLLTKPFGVAVDQQDNLLLADTSEKAVYWFDLGHHTACRWDKIGPYGLVSPVAVARDQEIFYVADSALPAVLAFDRKGRCQFALTNQLQRPAGLALRGRDLFVADAGAHRILVFDHQGHPLRQFGRRGTAPGEFNFPTHLAIDSNGRLLVTDSMNSRVQICTPEGQPLAVIGSPGDGPGHFSRPKGVAVDSFGHIYVADALLDNIQVFDGEGKLLLHFGAAGQEAGEFWLPGGVAIGRKNRLYVADTYNGRVQVFEYVGGP